MDVSKLTNIFQYTSQPKNASQAIPHTGGWSESVWTTLNPSGYNGLWTTMAQRRACLMCSAAAIVGYRVSLYTISGNKLLPKGTSSGTWLLPGIAAQADLPQAAFDIIGANSGVPNTSRLTLRGVPDDALSGGEIDFPSGYKAFVTSYQNSLLGNNFGFIGRDLSQPAARIKSYLNNVLTLDGPIGGVAGASWLRFHRCYDVTGEPVKGTYLIDTIAGNVYTLHAGPTQVVSAPSGTARIDLITYIPYTSFTTGRASVKKVGRPSQGYRGRRSKSRV
jgi:hypothetical protein